MQGIKVMHLSFFLARLNWLLLALAFGVLPAFAQAADTASLPMLRGARFDSSTNPAADSSSSFAVGLSIDAGLTLRTTALTTDQLRISGYVFPEAAHVGLAADLYIVARINGAFQMRLQSGAWMPWNGRVADLQAYRAQATLGAVNELDVFSGRIGASGTYAVFLGYRTADGVLRYTPVAQPITITTADQPISSMQWNFDGSAWRASSAVAPECPGPLLASVVDLARATSVLLPGQTRGGDYKAHGGFRFDGGQGNAIDVAAAMAGSVYRGARYIESGEVQYLFDIVSACGVMLRYDHLRTLSPKLAEIAATLPAATTSTQTTQLSGYSVSAGERIASAVGLNGNVSMDFGVYDLRKPNAVTPSRGGELAPYGICWLDVLPYADAILVNLLPSADAAAGNTSDYCLLDHIHRHF